MYLLSVSKVNFKSISFYGISIFFLLVVSFNSRADITLAYPESCFLGFNCTEDTSLPGIPSLNKAQYVSTVKQWAIENNLNISDSDIYQYIETTPYKSSDLDAISLNAINESGDNEIYAFRNSESYSILNQMRDIAFLKSMQDSINDWEEKYIKNIGDEDRQFIDIFDRAVLVISEYRGYTGIEGFSNRSSNPLISTLFGAGNTSYGNIFTSDGMIESFSEGLLIDLATTAINEESLTAGLSNVEITLKKPKTWKGFGIEMIKSISLDQLVKNKVISSNSKATIDNIFTVTKAVTSGGIGLITAPAELYYKTFSSIMTDFNNTSTGAYFTFYYYFGANYPELMGGDETKAATILKADGSLKEWKTLNNQSGSVCNSFEGSISTDSVASLICPYSNYKASAGNFILGNSSAQAEYASSIANLFILIKSLDIDELKNKVVQQIAVESARENYQTNYDANLVPAVEESTQRTSQLTVSISSDAAFNGETYAIQAPIGSEIKLSFDKYFSHISELIDADISIRPIRVQWSEEATPGQTFFVDAILNASTLQLIFESPSDHPIKIIGIQYPTPTGDALVALNNVPWIVKQRDSLVTAYDITVGRGYACALDNTGVVCWGSNSYGQLTPPSVLSNPVQISAGGGHVCAIDDTGVVCWGKNDYGQSFPPPLINPTMVSAGGNHTCAIDDTGIVCWGDNGYGQSSSPELLNPIQVSVGDNHSCAFSDVGIACWGNNSHGQSSPPVLINPIQVSAGNVSSCALDDRGIVCWGQDVRNYGGTYPELVNPIHVEVGYSSGLRSCALDERGLVCFGFQGFLGYDTLPHLSLRALSNPTRLETGYSHSCVIDDNGVECWGYSDLTPPDSLVFVSDIEEVNGLRIISETPPNQSVSSDPFVKVWRFNEDVSNYSVNFAFGNYLNYSEISVSGNEISLELTPDISSSYSYAFLQIRDANGNLIKVDNGDYLTIDTKTNHAPQLANGQVTQMIGGIEDTLALTIDTYDIDNDAVSLSVVNADGGNVSFTGNRLYALFGDNQTIHNIQIALNDGKESVIVDIPVLRYDSNTVKTIYSDVAIEHPYAKDIAFATLNGVIWGQDDLANNQQRLFKPDNHASWAEALKMVVKAAKVANKIDLPDSELYLQTYPQWAMPYYTFAREQGAMNFKQDDLSITYPTREEIAMLIVRSLGLDNKLEDYPELALEFVDKADFTDATMDRYGQIARIYGLFMTNDFAFPQGKVTRGELAQVISKIFMMPSAEIDVVNSVEFGDSFSINPLINRQAKIINDAYELVDSSVSLAVEYAINFQRLSDLTIDSSSMNVGSNTLIALVDNNGVRDFISKEIAVSFTDNDFDGVQDATDIWADDYRYQLDANQNQIPDILDSFYVLSGKTVEDTATMGHLTVPITQLISSGGFVCPQDEVTAFNPLSSEFQTFASLCDVPSAWVIFPGEPAIEPAAGTYHSRVAVSLQSPASTIIYYTLDGSEPDTFSTVYSSPLRLDESATVKMIAVSGDGEVSPMMSASYTVLNKHVWTPIPGLSWQWQLQGAVDQSVSARVYDVDLMDTPQETIATLKTNGSRVICYFNAGAWENWRSDAADYPEFIKGNVVDGFADEQWLDIRELDTLSPLMQTRFDLAVSKGCDAVEPDNVDGNSNNTGFSLTANDQLNYNLWLSNQANARGLSIGLKNNLAQIPTLEPFFDWALNEQCLEFNECDALQPFIASNKAVFGVEYLTETNIPDTASVCAITEANQYSWIIKRPELDSWVDSCADYRDFIDEDNDGVVDYEDNCLDADNLSQRDTDNDGFGNRCDADLNNDGVTNFADLAKFRQNFNTADPDADLNGDGIVNFADLAAFRSLFNAQPGPSAGH